MVDWIVGAHRLDLVAGDLTDGRGGRLTAPRHAAPPQGPSRPYAGEPIPLDDEDVTDALLLHEPRRVPSRRRGRHRDRVRSSGISWRVPDARAGKRLPHRR